MRRTYVSEGRSGGKVARAHAVVVNCDALQLKTVRRERRARELIARILDDDAIAGLRQNERGELQRALRAFNNYNSARIGDHAAELRDVSRDGFAQREQARRV